MKKFFLLVPALAIILAGCSLQTNTDIMNDTTTPSPMSEELLSPSVSPGVPSSVQQENEGVMVGGAMMLSSRTLLENARNSEDHQTLVQMVNEIGLAPTLETNRPLTIFAPTDEAFEQLPAGTLEKWLQTVNRPQLTKVLTYHAVAGEYTTANFTDGMKLRTVQGGELTLKNNAGKWQVIDAQGKTATIVVPDVKSSNGVTFVIDTVLMPQ